MSPGKTPAAVVARAAGDVVSVLAAAGDRGAAVADAAMVMLVGEEVQRRLAAGLGRPAVRWDIAAAQVADRLLRGLHRRGLHWSHALVWLALIPEAELARLVHGLRPPEDGLGGRPVP